MDVPLREYIESLIAAERCARMSSEHDSARALELQAKEVERRLELLNGEHGRLTELTRPLCCSCNARW